MSSNREEPLTFTSSSPITVSDQLDSFHADPSTVSSSSHLGSASNSFQNDTFLGESSIGNGIGINDAEYGFSRPEFRSAQLAGTVDLYDRHVFLCYKNPSVWPPRIEAAEFDRLPRLLSAAVGARKANMKREFEIKELDLVLLAFSFSECGSLFICCVSEFEEVILSVGLNIKSWFRFMQVDVCKFDLKWVFGILWIKGVLGRNSGLQVLAFKRLRVVMRSGLLKIIVLLITFNEFMIHVGLKETRLTICEGHDGTETSNGDVLIFPDMIRYRRLTHFDVDTFVEEVLVKDGEWQPGTPETLKGWYVFVCSHGSRDRRCGVCGPPLVSRFKEEIEIHGLHGKVSVSPCSHIGGHKYAGNVIIFGSNINGEVTGHWYGYVTPDDIPILLEQHIGKGEIVDWLWRGQMGLSAEDQMRSQELRLQLNGEANIERSSNEVIQKQLNDENAGSCRSQVEVMGCCQENGESCCQNPISPVKTDNSDTTERAVKATTEKKRSSKKLVSRMNSGKGTFTRKVRTMPTWLENWEREDTYASLAVVCAAVSVFVAYSCYKQLR
ncbi:hypothetical protein JRO89_XS15G0183100 [Xanthoceras sorbifolium]|uniref:Sucrase/ferredoxin-like family protein n=1 Tax=Xanthoceras sorbifolium TaxID=99658 RepID=A0ABQ8H2V2_9ROSI|nr:hypothetical protein JRO89_XS15G0183100 [Xanthoceras sorbifolium]